MSWNGYSKRVRNSVIKSLETNRSSSILTDDDNRNKNLDRRTIQQSTRRTVSNNFNKDIKTLF